jgi:hypothetical protein
VASNIGREAYLRPDWFEIIPTIRAAGMQFTITNVAGIMRGAFPLLRETSPMPETSLFVRHGWAIAAAVAAVAFAACSNDGTCNTPGGPVPCSNVHEASGTANSSGSAGNDGASGAGARGQNSVAGAGGNADAAGAGNAGAGGARDGGPEGPPGGGADATVDGGPTCHGLTETVCGATEGCKVATCGGCDGGVAFAGCLQEAEPGPSCLALRLVCPDASMGQDADAGNSM